MTLCIELAGIMMFQTYSFILEVSDWNLSQDIA